MMPVLFEITLTVMADASETKTLPGDREKVGVKGGHWLEDT